MYVSSFFVSFVCTTLLSTITACLLTALFLYPCFPESNQSRLFCSVGVAALATAIWIIWTIVVTTNHRAAVEDLLAQLTSSIDTLVTDALSDALELVKTAHSTWKFTGTRCSLSQHCLTCTCQVRRLRILPSSVCGPLG